VLNFTHLPLIYSQLHEEQLGGGPSDDDDDDEIVERVTNWEEAVLFSARRVAIKQVLWVVSTTEVHNFSKRVSVGFKGLCASGSDVVVVRSSKALRTATKW
jgi:hypothetical protein